MKHNQIISLYEYDMIQIKDYRIRKKITLHRSIRQKGFEIEENNTPKGEANEEKLDNNISRAKSKVLEYAMCNNWQYFITLTINPKKYDRKDLKKYKKDLTQFIRDERKRIKADIKYLLIPEKHKDGNWHMHGLIKGIPEDELKENEHGYKDWNRYRKKFGYVSVDKIKSEEAVAKYITKYITKDLVNTVKELEHNLYYVSQGLQTAKLIIKGRSPANNLPIKWDYTNDYVKCKWIENDKELLNYLYHITDQ